MYEEPEIIEEDDAEQHSGTIMFRRSEKVQSNSDEEPSEFRITEHQSISFEENAQFELIEDLRWGLIIEKMVNVF